MKVLLLGLLSLISLALSFGWMMRGMDAAHKRIVLSHARGIAEVMAQSRQVYAKHRSDQSVLPIRFALDLADTIQAASVTIYSPHPFPANKEGGLHDDFQKAAWIKLADEGEDEYMVWEGGVLRYAVPDIMSFKCVQCHNTTKDTPKADWKIGDVRGVIEVALPW